MMIFLLLGFLLAAGCSAQGYNGSAESMCNVNTLPVLTNFDPKVFIGKWYFPYKSHYPPYFKNVADQWYDIQFKEVTEGNTTLQFLVVNRTSVLKNRKCSSELAMYKVNRGILTASYEYNPNFDILFRQDVYILGVDTKSGTIAAYNSFLVNGRLSLDYTSVFLLVRDDTKPLVMNGVSKGLVKFCGPDAASENFFKKYPLDHLTTCSSCRSRGQSRS